MVEEEIKISRAAYDNANPEDLIYKAELGLTEELIREISRDKGEPEWLLEKRLAGFKEFNNRPLPKWGPDLSELDLDQISYYMKPNAKRNARKWEDVPKEIRDVYERLKIPQAEREALGGVGAQYESEVVYHKLKEDLEAKGVIFLDFDEAVKQHPDLVKEYFMTKCIPINLHKFSALHAAVFSGGTFIYVPKNVTVDIPLQAYFRMNAKKGGQFEHTLIIADEGSQIHYIEGCSSPIYSENSLHAGGVEIFVMKNARVRYTSIENWSRNTFNLNTKRAVVYENGIMEWVNGNLGSNVTMLYPCSILVGDNSKTDYLGIAYATTGQNQDTGCKVYHIGKNTSSSVLSKGISQAGGITTYRGLVEVKKGATGTKANMRCDGLMLDNRSQSSTRPSMNVFDEDVKVAHEAAVGKIEEDQLFYLMSRGIPESEAIQLIVSGFIEPLIKELPLEYALELNNLINLEIENSVA